MFRIQKERKEEERKERGRERKEEARVKLVWRIQVLEP